MIPRDIPTLLIHCPGRDSVQVASSPAQDIQVKCYLASAYLLFNIFSSLKMKMLSQFESQSLFFQHPHSERRQNLFALRTYSSTLSRRQKRRPILQSFQNCSCQGGSCPCVPHCTPLGWEIEVQNSLGLQG